MRKIVLAALAVLAAGGSALAENFPSHPITIIVPFSAGGPSDAMARILAERMKATLGEALLIENVTGAGGSIGVGRAVRESKGFAIAVTDETISAALNEVAREEGLLLCPEGAATYAAYRQSLADGRVTKNDRVMLFNCATGLKYPLPPVTRTLDRHQPIDYAKL